jgi:predicted dehydrogenase
MASIKVAIIGAGMRGRGYARYAGLFPDQMQVVAVAEPDALKRTLLAEKHDIPLENCFTDWTELLAQKKLADAVFVCTTDKLHAEPTLAALQSGYEVLLEKPMSPVLAENISLVNQAEQLGRLLQICHVLRYTAFFQAVRQIVQSGQLGRVINVTHSENLIYWHMAHSFVRGNWRNKELAGPMLLSKCCHDFDILYWTLRQPVRWLSSFGALSHFRPENAPPGATQRCTDNCPAADNCKYYAPRLYASSKSGFPFDVVTPVADTEARLQALKDGWYGRCVYFCDNDVVDHQTVNMVLEDDTTVTLVMNGHGNEECRTIRYDGTLATLYGKFTPTGRHELNLHHHQSRKIEPIEIKDHFEGGHGGGDMGIVQSFLNVMRGIADPNLTTARESLESHLLVFAAEESRLNHKMIDMQDFRSSFQ